MVVAVIRRRTYQEYSQDKPKRCNRRVRAPGNLISRVARHQIAPRRRSGGRSGQPRGPAPAAERLSAALMHLFCPYVGWTPTSFKGSGGLLGAGALDDPPRGEYATGQRLGLVGEPRRFVDRIADHRVLEPARGADVAGHRRARPTRRCRSRARRPVAPSIRCGWGLAAMARRPTLPRRRRLPVQVPGTAAARYPSRTCCTRALVEARYALPRKRTSTRSLVLRWLTSLRNVTSSV